MTIVLQKSSVGKYAGPLLHGRFQVLESMTFNGQYILADHEQDGDPVWDDEKNNGQIRAVMRFGSIQEAETFAGQMVGTPAGKKVSKPRPSAPAPRSEKAPRAPKAPTEKKRTPARAFHELITTTALSDEEVFAKVKEEFGETSYRPTYPAWYRRQLANKKS